MQESYDNTLQEFKSKGATDKNVHYVQMDSKLEDTCRFCYIKVWWLALCIANASVSGNSFAHELEIDEWQKVIDINLTVFSHWIN